MKAVVIIPARYGATRFPGKVIAPLLGKPLIQHVYNACRGASLVDDVIIATDSDEVLRVVQSFGGKGVLTSAEHPSGTDRIAEVARGLECDVVVNVQGDEPLINGEMIDEVVRLLEDRRADMGTLVKRTSSLDEIFDPNVVKAVFDRDGFALYFSRSPIPFYRGKIRPTGGFSFKPEDAIHAYKHIGIYSYRKDVLIRLTELPQSELEKAEKLEQLRALEAGFRIKVAETPYETIGVDVPDDLKKAEGYLKKLQV
jgi:3-deoxy-manno-octulosonate cytidylyltransferase (CMP-KDO synthetase)